MQFNWCPENPAFLKCWIFTSGKMSVPIHLIHFTRHLISTYSKNFEQSTLNIGNSVKLQMCCPKFFSLQNTNDSYTQSGSALWMKKAPSVVSSCNSLKTTKHHSLHSRGSFHQGYGSPQNAMLRWTVRLSSFMLIRPYSAHDAILFDYTCVVQLGSPWISSVNYYILMV